MVSNLTNNEFQQYKKVANKVLDLLIKENYSSIKDISIIYNIIMRFPYCLDTEGQYTYNGKFYNSLEELPKDGLAQYLYRLQHNTTI